ncbi:threonine transporter RhtB [Neorhizobium sp. T786]|uniref:LysE family translocator n=1 Tax=Pseudorhizobium xiangyangii TaxID=2883104 RepID=UPI001CFF7B41|nr:threonine transporter RhtB [Neorhizobium xiangyangii]MCB5203230.1 threonine transporter RhtB [Neorhizobium xiangyangii]
MHVLPFIAGILLLLLTPGPTNTLMMLAGYARGWKSSLTLVVAELGGYLTVIIPVCLVAAPFFTAYPVALLWARGAAVVWILFLSWRLWRSAGEDKPAGGEVDARRVYVTTVLNPKAPIIALAIMPQGAFLEILPWLGLFSGLVLFAANSWIVGGALVARGAGSMLSPQTVKKVAATGLLGFAVLLAGSSVHAMS